MKTIGLIGGVSWVSTQEYYKRINLQINEKLGGNSSARILLSSLNFDDILPSQLAKDSQKEAEILIDRATALERAGADVLLICSNTTNMMAHAIQQQLKIPLLNIVEAIAEFLIERNLFKVGLLGTKRVMYGDFFKRILNQHKIAVTVPAQADGNEIDRIIYEELVRNEFKQKSAQTLSRCINSLSAQQVDAVILGCTELPLAVKQKRVDVQLIDCIQVHVDKVLQYVLH